jgi:hypothetical protein
MTATPDIPDTTANVGAIEGAAGNLDGVAAAITGHGNDVTGAINKAAFAFSDIVTGPIKDIATKNQADWASAVQAVTYGAGVTRLWSANVQTFKTERQKLETEWQNAVSNHFNLGQPYVPGGATEAQARETINTYNAQVASAASTTASDITTRAHALLEQLHTDANARAAQIRREPTDADLQQLAQAGLLSWAAYVSFPPGKVPPPVTAEDGRRAAQDARDALSGRAGPEAFARAKQFLDAINGHAALALKNGQQLTVGELAFLSEFYRGLDGHVLDIPKYVNEHFPAAAGAALLTAIGGGILALSNEKLGGGFGPADAAHHNVYYREGERLPVLPAGYYDTQYYLPEELRTLLTKQVNLSIETQTYEDTSHSTFLRLENQQGWEGLGQLLHSAPRDLVGGTTFSGNLTERASEFAHALSRGDVYKDPFASGIGVLSDLGSSEEFLRGLVDVSTRNHDANANVLHFAATDPAYGEKIASLLTYQYNDTDNGTTASHLIDWIPGAKEAGGAQSQLADRAAQDLFGFLGSANEQGKGGYNLLIDIPGAEGNDSIGARNPAVARALGAVTVPYLEAFAVDPSNQQYPGIHLNEDQRVRLFTLTSTDPQAADGLSAAVAFYQTKVGQDWVHGSDVDQEVLAKSGGRLAAYFERSVFNEALDRGADAQAAQEAAQLQRARGNELVKLALGLPGVLHPGIDILSQGAAGIYGAVTQQGSPPLEIPDKTIVVHTDAQFAADAQVLAAYGAVFELGQSGKIPAEHVPDLDDLYKLGADRAIAKLHHLALEAGVDAVPLTDNALDGYTPVAIHTDGTDRNLYEQRYEKGRR